MNIETFQRAQVINTEMITVFNRAEELKAALATMENGYKSHELIIHVGANTVRLDSWAIEKALKANIKELETRYSALSAELEGL